MITRATNLVVVEGSVVLPTDRQGEEITRQRVEIDLATGLTTSVGPPRGTGDLVLGDEYLVLPGMIDLHVHAREDSSSQQSYKECFATAGQAALHGGVTAFADMPNNPRPPVDDASYVAKKELTTCCPVDVLLFAGIGRNTHPLSFSVPYKAYMGPSVGHLFFDNAEALREALPRYRGHLVAFHAEAPEILRRHQNAATHAARRPPEAEVEAIDLALRLCENYQIEPHICHLSTAEGLRLLTNARARGLPVTCEVSPHHLFYDMDNAETFARPAYLQCNPPLRSRLDRIALLTALRDGEIDFLATDHAPHTIEEKERGTSGVTHLDTFAAFAFWLRDEGFRWRDIVRVCSENPGRFLGRFLPRPYGKIAPGYVGSLTVVKKGKVTVRRSRLKTRSGWSPFEGRSFDGSASHTIVRGHIYPQG